MSNMHKILKLAIIAITLLATSVASADSIDLKKALRNPGFSKKRTSVMILEAENGFQLASHNPDMMLNPASCMKILTTVTALSSLGPDYRFKTDFLVDQMSSNGTVKNLYVSGTGDPTLVTEQLWTIARELYDLGLRKVTGAIVIDDHYFDSYDYPKKKGNSHKSYAAQTSALAVNFNAVSIHVAPGHNEGSNALVTIEPPTDYFRLINNLNTGGKHHITATSNYANGRETITVTGNITKRSGPGAFRRSIKDPTQYAASVVRYVLRQNGIEVGEQTISGRTPARAYKLYSAESKPLGEIIRSMNKYSNNFMSEQIVKHLGAVRHGLPGSTEKGIKVIEGYLTSIGIPPNSYVIENGSGLSSNTRLSATQLANVLSAAYRDFTIRPDFMASLAIVGVDGTTRRWKFANSVHGIARVKTGTLGGVSTLAGYVPMKNGSIAAFAILANGLKRGVDAAHKAQIGIVKTVAEAGPYER
ncbi:MAG: D-alanyl-D-alanine carboxypeptidase/D-alanyl-D-alanine-endopeptidase [Deltaproteobacteria bacterium]|jgi:serine-type D-Ala-D-Ala carboxypeptidase/endopeptidase (penicillin-binding protein 4)|nr:D-alanyl-D-alanine carboxypeptidase/D-alanyl-D-alanine-endopeptidase [Deltaproteobacteria bacterium]